MGNNLIYMRRRLGIMAQPHRETQTGDLVTFTGIKAPLSIFAPFSPIQSLNGQANPYPPGGGKNKVPYPFSSPDGTYGGVQFTTTGEKIVASGTTTGSFSYTIGAVTLPAGTYRISVDGTHTGVQFKAKISGTTVSTIGNGTNAGFTLESEAEVTFVIERSTTDISIDTHFQCEEGSTATDWSPYSNLCPIYGWTGCEVNRTGKNLLPNYTGSDTTKQGITYKKTDAGTVKISGLASSNSFLELFNGSLPAGTYTFRNPMEAGSTSYRCGYKINGASSWTYATTYPTFTVEATDTLVIWLFVYPALGTVTDKVIQYQFEKGSTASDYENYSGTTLPVNWQDTAGTVYGGSLQINTDGTGVLTNTQYGFDLGNYTWTFDSTYNRAVMDGSVSNLFYKTSYARDIEFLCNKYKCIHNRESIGNVPDYSIYSQRQTSFGGTKFWVHDTAMIGMTSEQIKTYLTGTIVVYPLLNPVTYNLTSQQVGQLLANNGVNNVWSNANGQITVNYWKH